MKILFCPAHSVYDEYEHGSEQTVTYTIADHFSSQDTSSFVITGAQNVLEPKPYRILELRPGQKKWRPSLLESLAFNAQYTVACYRALTREQFDVIHHVRPFAFGNTFNLIPLLGLNRGTPFIIGPLSSPYASGEVQPRDHNHVLATLKSLVLWLPARIATYLSIVTLRRSTKVLVYDAHTKKLLGQHIPEHKIVVIPPGKHTNHYEPQPTRRLSSESPVRLLSVGYLNYRKGYDITLAALPQVLKQYPAAHLTIVGAGQDEQYLKQMVRDAQLEDAVTFTGMVEHRDLPSLYAQADVFIHMARAESYAQALVEALAAGLPIISSDTVAAQHIIAPAQAGVIIPTRDSETLSQTLSALVKDVGKRQQLSRQARQHCLEVYDWTNKVLPRYQRVYSEVQKRT